MTQALVNKESKSKRVKAKAKASFFAPAPIIQKKMSVGAENDSYEVEADNMANKVMRMQTPNQQNVSHTGALVQRKCAACEEDKIQKKPLAETITPLIQRFSNSESGGQAPSHIESQINSSRGSGSSMDYGTKHFMESRFGTDFSNVKIHTGSQAVQMSRELNAQAFTVGNDIYFNEGKYSPNSDSGKHLLAHELTHTVQQGKSNIRRQLMCEPEPDFVDMRDGAPNAATCGGPSTCPATFCQPYTSENLARRERDRMAPILLAGIGLFVNSRVLPLWSTYLFGGSATQNLTSQFGADFTASPTTTTTTSFLISAISRNLLASPPSFPTGVNMITLNLSSLIPTEITAINTSGNAHEMNFNVVSDIAGNIAGGIGTNQTSCSSGAQPSPFNDARLVTGSIIVIKNSSNSLTVIPLINYQVKDTIDLCPGNCGSSREQIATVPMSQFEATGISGDVPFTIDFPSNALPFTLTLP
ncbi:DUF4157 domain-containing protein [Flavobacterium jejuense]|uniref:DUF4157 domain-containing protein n=1 Tax=Flavobacterium jejuense TaxID=1544455 RepID=A0ABX0IYL0_9FLAO|nr:DUF4157 domain-containing protein [Flavobacterium jejuense]NHN27101.1 DUF4157 domain-containing protein [Flavobacterium jejuense]